jgi:branched-chain amino acid transport system permease protein
MLFEVTLSGVTLGGMYALVAMGLTLQYGVARIMNLSYGELLIAAAFAALWFYSGLAINPLIGLVVVPPVAFGLSYAIYRILLQPLVRRARSRDALEVDSILATFGLLFVIQGVMLALFGGAYFSYSFLAVPLQIAGATVAANRLLALVLAVAIGLGLYLALTAQLVAIDVRKASALAFALGGALVAAAGVLVSMFLTFNANLGVVFTLKALVVVIMGGVGNLLGALIAGLILGLVENYVAVFVDPGLTLAATYAIFLVVLLVRPQGILGRASR